MSSTGALCPPASRVSPLAAASRATRLMAGRIGNAASGSLGGRSSCGGSAPLRNMCRCGVHHALLIARGHDGTLRRERDDSNGMMNLPGTRGGRRHRPATVAWDLHVPRALRQSVLGFQRVHAACRRLVSAHETQSERCVCGRGATRLCVPHVNIEPHHIVRGFMICAS